MAGVPLLCDFNVNTSVTVLVAEDSLLIVSVPVVSSSALFFKKTSSTDRTESVAVRLVPAKSVASDAIAVSYTHLTLPTILLV